MKVLFFASLRERLGCAEVELSKSPLPSTTAELRDALSERSESWHDALNDPRLLIAVNQQIVPTDHALSPDDEVAFFPPVTGG